LGQLGLFEHNDRAKGDFGAQQLDQAAVDIGTSTNAAATPLDATLYCPLFTALHTERTIKLRCMARAGYTACVSFDIVAYFIDV
jgi:hypothetical protein